MPNQKPLSEMADFGYENMSEGDGYILSEMKLHFSALEKKLEEKASDEDLIALHNDLEKCKCKFAMQKEMVTSLATLSSDMDHIKIYQKDVTITSAELLALFATPKGVVGSPGAGKYIEITKVEYSMTYNGVAYTTVTAAKKLSLEYETSGQIIEMESLGFLDQTSDQGRCARNNSSVLAANEAVVVKLLDGEILTGDSDLKVRVQYRIVTAL